MGKELVRVRVFAGGRVQGVAFRFYAEKCAGRLGITGWARNLPDGRVEVLAEGPAKNVDRFLDQLRRGPDLARVDSFDVLREEATGEFADFRVVYFDG